MDPKDLKKYFALEEQITEEANDLLKWFSKDVNSVMNVDELSFNCIEDGLIFYEGYWCQETLSFTLTSNLLLLNDVGREKYAEQFKYDLAEKQKLENEERDKELIQNKINQEIQEREELERLKTKYE